MAKKPRKFSLAQRTPPLDRWALHIDIPWEKRTPQQRKNERKIARIFEAINHQLADLFLRIGVQAEKPIRPVRLWSRREGSLNSNQIADYVAQFGGAEAVWLRAVVSPLTISDQKPAPHAEHSHLIQVSVCKDGHGYFSGGAVCDAIVRTSEEKWPLVIQDILLDVAMFHSLPERRQRSSLDQTSFIAQKVTYAVGLKRDSCYGPVQSKPKYLSLASFCRTGLDLEVEEYVRRWASLLKSLEEPTAGRLAATASASPRTAKTGRLRTPVDNFNRTEVVSDILRRHKKAQQISARKLQKLISTLPPGEYFLLRTEKKPRTAVAQSALTFIFGRGQWKIGKLRAVPVGTLKALKQYDPYISILRFEVPSV